MEPEHAAIQVCFDPASDIPRRPLGSQLDDDGRWNEHLAIKRGQDVRVLDRDEIAERAGVGNNQHGSCRSGLRRRLGLVLLPPESRARLGLSVEVFDRIFERDAVLLQESVELVARGDVQKSAGMSTELRAKPV